MSLGWWLWACEGRRKLRTVSNAAPRGRLRGYHQALRLYGQNRQCAEAGGRNFFVV
jgi:hypothetical protein